MYAYTYIHKYVCVYVHMYVHTYSVFIHLPLDLYRYGISHNSTYIVQSTCHYSANTSILLKISEKLMKKCEYLSYTINNIIIKIIIIEENKNLHH